MTKQPPADLIHQDADLIEDALQMQSQGLEMLLAEMQVLTGMLSGIASAAGTKTEAEIEAETEAGFDDMPV